MNMKNVFKKVGIKTWIVAVVVVAAGIAAFAAAQNAGKPAPAAPDVVALLGKTLALYTVGTSYEVKFYLQQPKTQKEADDSDKMGKLRETYHLLYKRGANLPAGDRIRLEGVVGSNQKTIVVFPDKNGRVTVYRPKAAPLETPREDKRMVDFFKTDMKLFASDLLDTAKDPKSNKMIEEAPCKIQDSIDSKGCFKISLTMQVDKKVAYINKNGYSIERYEYLLNRKNRDGSDNYGLTWRMEWFDYKVRDISDEELSRQKM